MEIKDILLPGHIWLDVKAGSRRHLLSAVAELAARQLSLPMQPVIDTLLEREQLGNAAIGNGVAMPHARLEGLHDSIGFLALMAKPVPFDAPDNIPVDIVFLLLAPPGIGGEFLALQARITRLLHDKNICDTLRGCRTTEAAYVVLTQGTAHKAA